MTGPVFFTEELSNSKVAAIYPSAELARRQAERLRQAMSLSARQVQVLVPGERHPGRKLEPESHNIFRTMIWAHVRLGVIGAIAGLMVYVALRMADIPAVDQSPWLSWLMLVMYGGIFGLMLGGLVTLRPDHDRYVMRVQEALGEGDSAVVVHATSAWQKARAKEFLEAGGAETASTL
ncbi:hypothetical protein [Pseudoxanthomonas indica]|uniref:Riboflavin biosynthesis protein RibA n=1 Tax=Pseudoxanthomonas indica TaxID=428993 RepID=A0A1T5JG22_9GAMM|nr:hypothetical protein [Pseudoxanthomonas indica]GGD58491.1 hypothetical protein GCM10007235_33550 [Pseudoxanthomonas indica]SKC50421.1 hypothetical protein SAMN06296058_0777 [Pseudoxanthomonas indica]